MTIFPAFKRTELSLSNLCGSLTALGLISAALTFSAAVSHAQTAFLDFSSGLGGWTTKGSTTLLSAKDAYSINGSPYSLTPAVSYQMVRIDPLGSTLNGATAADGALGLTAGTINGLLNKGGSVTNFGLISKSFAFDAGTYSFAWAYAATDYQPYNDGVLFSVVGGGSQSVLSLARNGSSLADTSGPSNGTLILGSYGSTTWVTTTFDIATASTYQVSFAAYNWGDTSVSPIMYVSGVAGTFTGASVKTSGGTTATNIDTSAGSFSASNLGTTVNPVFDGGTLLANTTTVNNAFTVKNAGGTIQAQAGVQTNFSGVISDAAASSGSLTITNAGTGGSVALTAANTYSGATTVNTGATLILSGGGSLVSTNILINSGGTFNDTNSGLSAAANVKANGRFTLGADETIAQLTVNSGVISGAGTLTAATYALNDGSTINANLGSGLLVSNGTVLLNGISAAETLKIQSGALILGTADRLFDQASVDVSANAHLVLANGSDTIRMLTGVGYIDLLNGSVLTVGEGTFAGSATGTGALLKNAATLLTLSGNNTYTAGTIVRQGELNLGNTGTLTSNVTVEQTGTMRVNGLVQGTVRVNVGGTLNGSGIISSNVTNFGLTAPGNSPGILTVLGDYAESGTLNIEIDGRAGVGVNPSGHDQLKVGGAVTLNSGSTLLLTRSVANGFEPALGDRFRVIDAAGGIFGGFSFLDRSAFSTKLLFDYGTGYVFGTGLGSNEAFASLGGNKENPRSLATLISFNAVMKDQNKNDAFIDSRTAPGAMFKALLDSSSPARALETLSPSPYAGLTEYALRVTRNYSRDTTRVPTLTSADGWQVSAGYTSYRQNVDNHSPETDFIFSNDGGSVGISRQVSSQVVAGAFYAQDKGWVHGRSLAYETSGFTTGLSASLLRSPEGRFSAEAGASYGSYEFDGKRSSLVSLVTGKTDARTYDLWTGASYLILRGKRVSLSALADLAYTVSYVNGFSEKGGIDAFRIHGMQDNLFIGEIGAEAVAALTNHLSITGRATQSQNFQDRRREVFASFLSGGGRARVVAPTLKEEETDAGAALRFTANDRIAVSAYYDTNLSGNSGAASKFGVRVRVKL